MAATRFLFHGTPYASAILRDNRLRIPSWGESHVSLTRSIEEAERWAQIIRDDDDGVGVILVLSRAKLISEGYRPIRFVSDWATKNEYEEAVSADIHPLHNVLVGAIVLEDKPFSSEDVVRRISDVAELKRRSAFM